jgi:hypothetical protein
MAPHKAGADAFSPSMPKEVPKFDHLWASWEQRSLQAKESDTFEQPLLSQPKPLVRTRVDPLKGDPRIIRFHHGN